MLNRITRKIYNEYRLSIIAKRVFDAALTDKQKSLVDDWAEQRKSELSFGPMFSRDRTYFNIGKSSLSTIQTPQEIVNILDSKGYYCPDYREGYVYKKDDKLKTKPVKLIKILRRSISDNQQFNMLKKQFDQRLETSRKQMLNCLICITHNPYDVAGMSTDRSWTSCMELPGINKPNGGCHYYTALKQVKYGGMCAYLIQNNDKMIQRPLARIAIKRLVGNNSGYIFIAQTRIYGDSGFANQLNFVEEVEKILEESNKQTMNNENFFERKDENSWTDSDIHKKYMFKDDNQMLQYFIQNIDDCIRNRIFIESLTDDQLHFLFPYIIKDIDINYKSKIQYLCGLIERNKLTSEQEKSVINVLIKKQDTQNLYRLIRDDKLIEEQKKLVIDIMIKKQDAWCLFLLIIYDKLTSEQRKLAMDIIFEKQDTHYLYRLTEENKLTKEQKKLAISILIKKHDIKHLSWLIYHNKLTEEQKKSVIDMLIREQDTQNLFNLIYNNKLTEEQKKSAIDIMIKKQDTWNLYQLIDHNKLTEEQKKSAISVFVKKQDTQDLYWLICKDKLTSEQKKSVIDFFIKKQDTNHLSWLIRDDKLTEQQIKQFNLSSLK